MDSSVNLHGCQACGHNGGGNYCSKCGQAYATHRITLKHLLHEVVHFFTHLEHGFIYTIKRLIITPGAMQKEYLAGKRVMYQKPFSLFFLCGTVTALALYGINNAVIRLYAADNDAETHFYQHYFTLLQACLLPAYSAVLYLIFGRRYNFAEYLVIMLYNTSILFLFVSLANTLKLAVGEMETGYVEIVFVLLYNIFTNINLFSDKGKVVVVLKTLVTSVLCFLISRVAMEMFITFFIAHK